MVGGESIDSNLYPNRIPTAEWMNQAIGYFLIGFCLKCSYQKQQQQCANQLRALALIVIFLLFGSKGVS